MARIPLIEEDEGPLATLIAKPEGTRRGRRLNLYRVLLHSPSTVDAWHAFNSVVRFNTALAERTRELALAPQLKAV